jgi:hypothetical protein
MEIKLFINTENYIKRFIEHGSFKIDYFKYNPDKPAVEIHFCLVDDYFDEDGNGYDDSTHYCSIYESICKESNWVGFPCLHDETLKHLMNPYFHNFHFVRIEHDNKWIYFVIKTDHLTEEMRKAFNEHKQYFKDHIWSDLMKSVYHPKRFDFGELTKI